MQAIGSDRRGRTTARRGFIGALPAPARRLARRFEGFLERQATSAAAQEAHRLPLGRGTALALGFVAAGAVYGGVLAGTFGTVASHAAAGLGVGVGDVAIEGIVETTPGELYAALGMDERPSVVGLDLHAARERVLQLPWVKTATLRTVYPGRLSVAVVERQAFAVWQSDRTLTVVERTGRPITAFGIEDLLTDRFGALPNVVGEGAAEHAAELLPIAARHPLLSARIRSYIRVADRRWDVVFDNGVRLKLPEHGIESALARFAALEAEHELLARPIETADLRDPTRLALRLRADAAKERQVAVKKHLKDMERAEPRRGAKRL